MLPMLLVCRRCHRLYLLFRAHCTKMGEPVLQRGLEQDPPQHIWGGTFLADDGQRRNANFR